MKKVAAAYSEEKIHVVLDNASPHLSAETAKWLDKQNGRFVFHFTPTSASWLNEVEIWNGILTRKVIRRGTFSSTRVLTKAIDSFTENWNETCEPFEWTATADDIIEKVRSITAHMQRLTQATEIGDVAPPPRGVK